MADDKSWLSCRWLCRVPWTLCPLHFPDLPLPLPGVHSVSVMGISVITAKSPLPFEESLQPAPHLAHGKCAPFIYHWSQKSPLFIPFAFSECCQFIALDLKVLDHSQPYTPKKYDKLFQWFFQNSLHWFDTNRKTSFSYPMGEIHNTFTHCFKVITTFFSMKGFILYNWLWVIGWTV